MKKFDIFSVIFVIMGSMSIMLIHSIDTKKAEKTPRSGKVLSIGRYDSKRVAYLDNGAEVYVKKFPIVGTNLTYMHYTGAIFGRQWDEE